MELPSPIPTVQQLLPLIFSHPPHPLIPPPLLSIPLKNSHYFLSNVEGAAYYQLPPVSNAVEIARVGMIGEVEISKIGYRVEDGQITTRITLKKSTLSIFMILLWEAEEAEGSWRFSQLLELSSPIVYSDSLLAAASAKNIPISNNSRPVQDERTDGGGSTPGAYGDAKDFWEGWQSGEEEEEEEDEYNSTGFCMSSVQAPRAGTHYDKTLSTSVSIAKPNEEEKPSNQDDSDYWNSYGNSDAGGGDIGDSEPVIPLVVRSRRSSTIKQAVTVGFNSGFETPTSSLLARELSTATVVGNGNGNGNGHHSELEQVLKGVWKLFSHGKELEEARREWKGIVNGIELQ